MGCRARVTDAASHTPLELQLQGVRILHSQQTWVNPPVCQWLLLYSAGTTAHVVIPSAKLGQNDLVCLSIFLTKSKDA